MSRHVPDRTMLEEGPLQLQGKGIEPVVRSEGLYFGCIQADACLIGERVNFLVHGGVNEQTVV